MYIRTSLDMLETAKKLSPRQGCVNHLARMASGHRPGHCMDYSVRRTDSSYVKCLPRIFFKKEKITHWPTGFSEIRVSRYISLSLLQFHQPDHHRVPLNGTRQKLMSQRARLEILHLIDI